MLTRKAPVVLAAAVALMAVGITLQRYAAALLGGALLLLFAVGDLLTLPPRLDGQVDVPGDQATEGQQVTATTRLENRGQGTTVFEQRLDVPATFEEEDIPDPLAALGADETMVDEHSLRPRLLGVHHVGPFQVRVADPSGLRYASYDLAPGRDLLVLPAVQPLKTAPVELGEKVSFFGVHEASQPGDGFEFYTLRKWQHGDTIRSVNWRASARTPGELIVNQRARESFLQAAILVDARAPMMDGRLVSSPRAICARAVASLVDHLLHQRDRLHVFFLGEDLEVIHPQTPERQRQQVLERLATTEPAGQMPWEQAIDRVLPKLSMGAQVIMASSFETDPTIFPAIRGLAAREHPLLALSAPTDWPDPPPVHADVRDHHRRLVRSEVERAGGTFVELAGNRVLQEAFLEAVLGP